MVDIAEISKLLAIAEKAIAVDALKSDHLENMRKLHCAYESYKEKNNIIDRVDSSSDEWDRMKAATAPEYKALNKSRRDIYNAERRLATAIRKYRNA